jgi:hypothetical protein
MTEVSDPLQSASLVVYKPVVSFKIDSLYVVMGDPLSEDGAVQVKTTLVPT